MTNEALAKFNLRYHPHPIFVNFAFAYIVAAGLFSVLYIFTGKAPFELASYYMLILGALATPPTLFWGLVSWHFRFRQKMTPVFKKKINLSILLIVLLMMSLYLRVQNPGILINGSSTGYLYLALLLTMTPVVLITGYYGGRLVYPSS